MATQHRTDARADDALVTARRTLRRARASVARGCDVIARATRDGVALDRQTVDYLRDDVAEMRTALDAIEARLGSRRAPMPPTGAYVLTEPAACPTCHGEPIADPRGLLGTTTCPTCAGTGLADPELAADVPDYLRPLLRRESDDDGRIVDPIVSRDRPVRVFVDCRACEQSSHVELRGSLGGTVHGLSPALYAATLPAICGACGSPRITVTA